MPYSEMAPAGRRTYVLKERASRQADTRRRIVEATVSLHQEVGPAATTVSEVARRAGVERVTVYNHFADDESLFAACSAHWRSLHPAPDPETWLVAADPATRLRLALPELYRWYRSTASMTGSVLRDSELLPALWRVIGAGLLHYLDAVAAGLCQPFRARGRRAE